MNGPLKLLSGNANKELAEEISKYLGIPLCDAVISTFSDGETLVQINENMRGADAFVIQPTCPPVNQNLMELLTIIDALSRASAKRITAVIPYYGYGRQDRKVQPRVPITAKLVANLITASGADRVLTMDLHAGQIQGFFDIPVDHLFSAPVIIDYFKKKGLCDLVLVSPDAGGVERARAVAKRLDAGIAIIDKRREVHEKNVSQVMNVIGEVEGRNLIILDDIIDTGGTITQAAEVLKEKGAKEIYACCIHPVLSGNAVDKIRHSVLSELVVTNTIPIKQKKIEDNKITILSVASLLGEAIKRIHQETSVSSLFV